MPRRATMSLYGLYMANNDLFKDLSMPTYTVEVPDPDDPDAAPTIVTENYIDKDNFIYNLLLETAEFEVIYPDPDFMQEAIKMWSASRLHTWQRIALVLYEKYDPFINLKRDEQRIITEERDLANGGTSTYNQNAWNDSSAHGVQTNENTITGTDTGTITTTESFHMEGDSAITDAQDVAKKEIDLRSQYDLMQYMLTDFKKRFCLLIY